MWPTFSRLAALALLFLASTPERASAATQDWCASGDRTILLMVDRTTAYDATDKATLKAGLVSLAHGLEAGDRVVVRVIGASYTDDAPVFDGCVPGCPSGLTEWLIGTCKPVQARRDRAAYEQRLAKALMDMLANPKQTKTSDIAQGVAQATRSVAAADPRRTLAEVLIFSDMLENSPHLPGKAFRKESPDRLLGKLNGLDIVPAVKGARVVVWGFGRDDAPGRQALSPELRQRLDAFWRGFFRTGGAASVRLGQDF